MQAKTVFFIWNIKILYAYNYTNQKWIKPPVNKEFQPSWQILLAQIVRFKQTEEILNHSDFSFEYCLKLK